MSHSDENQIHKLISLYFRGMTNSEQEKILFDYFIDNKKEDLPADLRSYSDYFSSMAFFSLSAPTDLIKENNEGKAPEVLKVQFNLRKTGVWLSLTAATIVGIIFSLLFLFNDSTNFSDLNHDICLIPNIPILSVEQEEELYFMACQDKNEREEMIGESNLNKEEIISHIMTSTEIESPDNYIEIVDMDEAYKILRNVNEQISRILSPGVEIKNKIHEANKHISKTIEQIKIHNYEKSKF